MVAQNGDGSHYTISNGRLTAGALNVGGDLYIHKLGYTASSATGRQLTISANVVDNGTGPVRLVLSNSDAPRTNFFANNTTTLSGTGNTYTGGLVLNQGNVVLANVAGFVVPAGPTQLALINPTLTNSGNQGDSTVTVANASAFRVGQLVSGVGIPAGTTITAIDASTDPLNQVLTLSNALTTPIQGFNLTANSTVTLNLANLTTAEGKINPANRVILNAESTFTLAGNNTLAGLTINNNGGNVSQLAVAPVGATVNVGTGTLTLTDTLVATSQNPAAIANITGTGTLDLGGSTTAAINVAPIALAADGQNFAPWQPTLNISSLLSNFNLLTTTNMPIAVTGGGVLSLGGQSVFTSDFTVTGGSGLLLNASSTGSSVGTTPTAGPVGAGRFILGNGALLLSGASANAISNAVRIQGDFTFGGFNNVALNGLVTLAPDVAHAINVVVPTVSLTLGGVVSGSSDLVKTGLGNLVLGNGANDYTGRT
ncbi:MAG: hypothetical protein EBR70_04450, partial [Verrucomicrobia bacterium]|nr:hypothetical protein [Verrucomicrobiota bacterium]